MDSLLTAPRAGRFELSPTFTLRTALAWLGHDCAGGCPDAAVESRAAVWFMHLPDTALPTWTNTLVEVDFTGPLWSDQNSRAAASEINRCVHRDRIRVRSRSEAERLRFYTALARRRAPLTLA